MSRQDKRGRVDREALLRAMREAMEENNRHLRSWNLPEIHNAEDAYQSCIESGRNPDAMTYGELVDWLVELNKERTIRGLKKLDDAWVPVRLSDIEQDRGTVARHAKDEGNPFVRKVGQGKYEIRRSELKTYLRRPVWEKYGLDAV